MVGIAICTYMHVTYEAEFYTNDIFFFLHVLALNNLLKNISTLESLVSSCVSFLASPAFRYLNVLCTISYETGVLRMPFYTMSGMTEFRVNLTSSIADIKDTETAGENHTVLNQDGSVLALYSVTRLH